MPDFEIAIYNADVRDRVAEGKRHRDLANEWADVHYLNVEAEDEIVAAEKIARKYPKHRGYVIESVIKQLY